VATASASARRGARGVTLAALGLVTLLAGCGGPSGGDRASDGDGDSPGPGSASERDDDPGSVDDGVDVSDGLSGDDDPDAGDDSGGDP
jgi:hypothetical protein